uniref:peroxidase n=1 Tax=Noccaea caerulescens TaxID=107243 RepID=A0A1J3IDM6_NOCCA
MGEFLWQPTSKISRLPNDSISILLSNFAALGLDTEDFVALIGGHTIGTTACKFIIDRIYSINGSIIDVNINPLFLAQLQSLCPLIGDGLKRVALDTESELVFDTSLYTNILSFGRAVLKTDQSLLTTKNTYSLLQEYVRLQKFKTIFMRAMSRMSGIGVKSGVNGEIRRNCSAVN